MGLSFAGADTSATTMRSTLLHIVTNPHILSTLLAEISSPLSNPITDEEARKLPYLQAVIKEGLRIFPPITGLLPKEIPKGGEVLGGMWLPGGTTIGWSVFGMMRNEQVWGPDARIFRPERWFEGACFLEIKHECRRLRISREVL
jgi:cytochrome P450